jgi:hypothetical protein
MESFVLKRKDEYPRNYDYDVAKKNILRLLELHPDGLDRFSILESLNGEKGTIHIDLLLVWLRELKDEGKVYSDYKKVSKIWKKVLQCK